MALKILTLDEWKDKFGKAGSSTERVVLPKQYAAEIKAGDDCPGGEGCIHDPKHVEAMTSRDATFTITTGSVDRERDTLAALGWRLEAYRRNPVVLWAHSYRDLPIGRARSVDTTDNGLRSVAEFTSRDLNPLGDTVLRMIRGGFLNAVSVGFNPLKWVWNEERRGIDFAEQELLEYSVVPVPANPEALVEARSKGIDISPISEWAARWLDEHAPERGVWVPRSQVEAAFKLLSMQRSYSLPARTLTADELRGGTLTLKAANPFGGETSVEIVVPKIEPSAPLAEPEPERLVLRISEPDPADREVTPEFIAQTLRDVVHETVTASVREQLTALTGRID